MDRGFKFHEIIEMTDRQKAEIIFHARDKHGRIKFPDEEIAAPPAATLEGELAAADQLAGVLALLDPGPGTPDEKRERIAEAMKAQLRAKYARREGGDGEPL